MHTYISLASNLCFKLSLIDSFDILLSNVRSETPTCFFLVVSKTALCGFPPDAGALLPLGAALGSFLRPARLVTA